MGCVSPPPSVIPYTSAPPSSLTLTTGAVSPLGWPVDFFDDFTGTFTKVNLAGWWSYQNPNAFTTGATYNGSPAHYGGQGQAHWGGYTGTETLNNTSMSGSNLICQATTGSLTSSVTMCWPSPWGIWEWSVKCVTNDGTRAGVDMGLWLSGPNWPQAGEIDVQETAVGAATVGGIGSSIHCGPSTDIQVRLASRSFASGTWNDGTHHIYSVIVTPSYVAVYVDGVLMASGSAASYLNHLDTTTDPPHATQAGSLGYLAQSLTGDPSTLSTGTAWISIMGVEMSSGFSSTVFPIVTSIDWFRHSKLTPATGGPHV